jgi:flagellar biosynthesis/type III secretory pathway protein FliH
MGKKKPAAKTAPPAPATANEDLTTQVLCVQQYQAELYEAIMAQKREQAYDLVKATIARTLEKGRASIFAEGRKEGYEEGVKEGVEQGSTAE